MKNFKVKDIMIGGGNNIVLIAGPCVIESRRHAIKMAKLIKEISLSYSVPFIYKASYDKANRTSINTFRGPGLSDGLQVLMEIKDKFDIPILSDVHSPEEARIASEVIDIVQIPAFLCRQTDLLISAGESGKIVNIKKGQFIAPWDIKHIIEKIKSTGNNKILLTERGTTFGYNYLVSDMRSLVIMKKFGYPVIFDATHSVQIPGGQDDKSGGEREFISILARAACAVGIDAIFVEVHDNPKRALSDGPNMLYLNELPKFLENIIKIDEVIKKND